jgi:hypothetical protein
MHLTYEEHKKATFLLNNRFCKNFSLGFIRILAKNLPIRFFRCRKKIESIRYQIENNMLVSLLDVEIYMEYKVPN